MLVIALLAVFLLLLGVEAAFIRGAGAVGK